MGNTKIGFNNFKAFGPKMQYFTKKPITIVYGPNSVGKSSLLHSQLYLEYLRHALLLFNIKKTNFAGDDLDLGGFKNFIHKHDQNSALTYEMVITKPCDLEKLIPSYQLIMDLYREGAFQEQFQSILEKYTTFDIFSLDDLISYESLRKNLLCKQNKDENIEFTDFQKESYELKQKNKKLVDFSLFYTYLKRFDLLSECIVNMSNYEIYAPEELVSKFEIYLELVIESLQVVNDSCLKLFLMIGKISESTYNRYAFISQIQNIKITATVQYPKDNSNWLSVVFQYFINDELQVQIGQTSDEFIINKNSILFDQLEYEVYNKSLTLEKLFCSFKIDHNVSILSIFKNAMEYFVTHEIKDLPHYFGPLRPYPLRSDMYSLEQTSKKEKEEKLENYLDEVNKFNEKLFSIPFLPPVIKGFVSILTRKGRIFISHSAGMTDMVNSILPKKFQIEGDFAPRSTHIWEKLILSVETQERLNKWLQSPKNFNNPYRIETRQFPISYIETWRSQAINYFLQNDKDILDKLFIRLSKCVEKILNLRQKYLTQLIFIDISKDTTVTPRDMGLGISQIIPILTSTFDSKKKSLYLEQPELHLHPKLQMELADEFIRSMNERENNFMIETHSEHLLLRIMKRMRQTANGTLADESLRLTPDDVCLLYVDNDGESTYLQELRLSSKGTLLDHWPHGFFEEGYKERFS